MKTLNILTEISKRLIRFIVSILANFLNIIVSLTIMLLNVYVSWNHTLELFHEAGFKREGYMDIAGVCAVELTFLLGSCHVIGARMKGRIPGWGSILTGALGVALIMWSNISAGVSHGITGVLIGIVVPLSIVACETILADAWREQAQATKAETKPQEVATKEPIPIIDEELYKEAVPIAHTKQEEPEPIKEEHTTEEEIHRPDSQPAKQKEEEKHHAREVAIQLYKENEQLPSIRKLAKRAGISEWKARKLREELKAQFG